MSLLRKCLTQYTSDYNHISYRITAFPVLCRILTELNLLETTVGIVVLSAGVGNDIVAWALLALAYVSILPTVLY